MSQHKGLSTPQNKFLETIVARSDALHSNFVLGNAQRKDYPIVYCSDGFLLLTQYSRANIMSRSSICQFLWGPKTSPKNRVEVVQAFHNKYEYRNQLILYTRHGECFNCELTITPIKNEKMQVVLFLCCYQELQTGLLKSVTQSSSNLKLNSSKLHTVLSWASELPFSKNYLQWDIENEDNSALKSIAKTQWNRSANVVDSSFSDANQPTSLNLTLSSSSRFQDDFKLKIPETTNQGSLLSLVSGSSISYNPFLVNHNSMDDSIDLSRKLPDSDNQLTHWSLQSINQSLNRNQIINHEKNYKTSSNSFNNFITRSNSNRLYHQSNESAIHQNKSDLLSNQSRTYLKKYLFQNENSRFYPHVINNSNAISNLYSSRTNNEIDDKQADSLLSKPTSIKQSNEPIQTYGNYNNEDVNYCKITSTKHHCNINTTSRTNISQLENKTNNEDDYIHPIPNWNISQTDKKLNNNENKNMFQKFFTCKKYLTCNHHHQSLSNDNSSSESSEPDPKCYNYKRRKSFAILHGLSEKFDHYSDKKHHPNVGKLNRHIKNFSGKNVPDYKIQKLTKSNSVLLHYGLFRIVWDWLLLLLTFYIAFMVPYNVTFESHLINPNRNRIIDLIVEVFLISDVILNFHTTYVCKSGQIVNDRNLIAKHYAKGWLILDLLAALPVDFILCFIQITSSTIVLEQINLFSSNHNHNIDGEETKISSTNSTTSSTNTTTTLQTNTKLIMSHLQQNRESRPNIRFNLISLLQMMKLARLLRLARLIQKIIRLSQYSVIVLGLLMISFALVAHWCACIWYIIGLYEIDGSEIGWLEDLARRLKVPFESDGTGGPTEKSKYFTALYFTCSSLTSVGFGNVSANTNREKVFAICIMLLGALMHAAVFGNVTAIIQRIYARRTIFQTKVQDLKEFIEVHRVPKSLKHRMEDYFQTTWAINRGMDVADILKIYPDELQGDIYLHLNREVLGLKVFQKANQDCLKCLALHFKLTFCTPGEYLIHSGDILRRLYFVSNGSLEILEKNEVVALLGKNDWFGAFVDSPSLSAQVIRSRCDVKSLTYCDLHCIDLIRLSEILNNYPQFKSEFKAYLYEDLSFNIQEGVEKFTAPDIITIPAITLQLASDDKEWTAQTTDTTTNNNDNNFDNQNFSNFNLNGDRKSLKLPLIKCDEPNSRHDLISTKLETGLLTSSSYQLNHSSTKIYNLPIQQNSFDYKNNLKTKALSYYPRRTPSTNLNHTSHKRCLLSKFAHSFDVNYHNHSSSTITTTTNNNNMSNNNNNEWIRSTRKSKKSWNHMKQKKGYLSQSKFCLFLNKKCSTNKTERRHTLPVVERENSNLKSSILQTITSSDSVDKTVTNKITNYTNTHCNNNLNHELNYIENSNMNHDVQKIPNWLIDNKSKIIQQLNSNESFLYNGTNLHKALNNSHKLKSQALKAQFLSNSNCNSLNLRLKKTVSEPNTPVILKNNVPEISAPQITNQLYLDKDLLDNSISRHDSPDRDRNFSLYEEIRLVNIRLDFLHAQFIKLSNLIEFNLSKSS